VKSAVLDDFRAQYASALEDYLSTQGEEPLHRAYELGHRAMQDGLGVLDVATMHGDALARLLSTAREPDECPRMTRQASAFLAETLSRAELFLRGFQDAIRELDASHQRLRLTERLAAIGTLSAGLGHDLANILLPIRVRLDKLQAEEFASDVKADLRNIRIGVDQLQNLSQGLRLLAMDADDGRASEQFVYVESWWNEVSGLFRNALPRHVELRPRFEADVPAFRIAPHQLTQAVFNLVQNAGEILRETYPAQITVAAERAGSSRVARLMVTDNGPGMSEETKQRCMEPFFTTRTRTLSTGLGLALVHNIIYRAGGRVEINTEPGRGTTFVLTLPAIHESGQASTSAGRENGNPELTTKSAVLSIFDPRISGIVQSLLHAMRFSVTTEEHMNEAQVWVVDDAGARSAALGEFLRSNSRHRAVVLGTGAPVEGKESQMIFVPDTSKVRSLREALENAVSPQFASDPWSNNNVN